MIDSYTVPAKLREKHETTTTGGRERLNDEVLLDLVRLSAGEFVMGAPEDEEGHMDREGLQHKVAVLQYQNFGWGSIPLLRKSGRWWRLIPKSKEI